MSTKLTLTKIKNSTHILHKDSGLVFRSQKERIVIGKFNNGEISSLNREDISICDQWGFKYDEELIEDDAEDQGEDDAEEQGEDDGVEDQDEVEENNGEDEGIEEQGDTNSVEDHGENNGNEEQGETTTSLEDRGENNNVEEEQQDNNTEEHSLKPNKSSVYLRDITSSFTTDLYRTFDNMQIKYISEITELQNKIITVSNKNEELDNKLKNETDNHLQTKDELNKLKTKFEGIKSLFS
jgi:hypothetical protein